jgi:hypothetical protein
MSLNFNCFSGECPIYEFKREPWSDGFHPNSKRFRKNSDAEDVAIYDTRKAELADGGVVLPPE